MAPADESRRASSISAIAVPELARALLIPDADGRDPRTSLTNRERHGVLAGQP
jgi:hypothetical protein